MMSLDKIKNVLNSAKDETARIVIEDENGLGYHIYDFSSDSIATISQP